MVRLCRRGSPCRHLLRKYQHFADVAEHLVVEFTRQQTNAEDASLRVAIKYYADVAELADAQDLGSCALVVCRFDSCHPHLLLWCFILTHQTLIKHVKSRV